MKSFSTSNLLMSIQGTLAEKGMGTPTEIQARTIPLLLAGKSVVGVSETGSGKTLAYALPVLHHLKTAEKNGDRVEFESTPRAVVMVPTRELGEQVAKVFKLFTHDTRLRVRPALGGMPMEQARRNVAGPFEVLVATPGRLLQLVERKQLSLSDVRMLVFDEADEMVEKGFLSDSKLIVRSCPETVQLILFSATVSATVQELITDLFSQAEIIRSAGSGRTVATLTTQNMTVENGKRWPVMEKVLAKKVSGGTLVFTNTREQCDALAKELNDKGFSCTVYRGEMDKVERRANLKKFREGKIDLLISTDLAARGLDVESVDRVINYHLPQQLENYLHRVGRTARAGRAGLVINLVTERDLPLISQIKKGL